MVFPDHIHFLFYFLNEIIAAQVHGSNFVILDSLKNDMFWKSVESKEFVDSLA